jgi:alcohol dehydrogenase class IV
MTGLSFEFATSNQISFGRGTFQKIGRIASRFGSKAYVILGVENVFTEQLINLLEAESITVKTFFISEEPNITLLERSLAFATEIKCDFVIGMGGGSAIDMAKAVSALRTNPGEVLEYLEVIGGGRALQNPSLPCIAIPTTSGTGAEVTRNAVLSSPEHRVKVSLRSAFMLPQVALVDPEITVGLPPAITASTGLDALTQVLEPYVSVAANPITDGLCLEGIKRAARSIRRVYSNGDDLQAREDMSLASLFGGMALANAKLGAVHGFAGVLGGMFPGPHGAICARLLPYVMEANTRALQTRAGTNEITQRFDNIAKILTGAPKAKASDGVDWIRGLVYDLKIPTLSVYGLREIDFVDVIEKAKTASSMKGNPILLTTEELHSILLNAL